MTLIQTQIFIVAINKEALMWKYESDGGGWWQGSVRISQPKTHYITNGVERIDCDSKSQAIKLMNKKNKEAL